MRLKIVAIGNSRGVRLPKALLEQSGIGEEVEVEVQDDALVLRAIKAGAARRGWSKAFQEMAARGDDQLLDPGATSTAWGEEEWEWK